LKVLLINPWPAEVFPPPSIGYLQSALRHWNVDVTARDLAEAMNEEDAYDIVGVSFHSFSVRHARQIRERFKKARLICGGHHPSAMPIQMLSVGYDQVVVGEGENAIISIVQGNDSRIIYSEEVRAHYFHSINDIPMPDYTGLSYTNEMGLPVISSRGCPFRCNFCASSSFWERSCTMRSPDNVLKEIMTMLSRGQRTWMFEDDNFTLSKPRAIEICNDIVDLDVRVSWQCASRAETLRDNDLVFALARAGCHTVWLGVESFSQRSLDRCEKNTTVEKMVLGIKNAQKHGIKTMCQFIVGMPGDTLSDIQQTARVMKQNGIHGGANILWILPNTQAYQLAKRKGWNDNNYLDGCSLYYTYEQDINTLNNWAHLINSV